MPTKLTLGIDFGGTNIKVAAVDESGKILARRVEPTDTTVAPALVIERMAALCRAAVQDTGARFDDVAGAGVGAPGPLSMATGRILRSANLPKWVNVPLRDELGTRLSLPVTLDNDANAAALGEFWVGAGKGGGDLVLLTLGTGLGAGIVLDGQVFRGHFENAGELGHTIVVPNGLPCPCGQHGCLEQYVAASAVARRAAAETAARTETSPAELEKWDSETVAERARAGDPICLRIWEEAAYYLGLACVNIQHTFNPARVLLGGGMAQAGDFLLDRVRKHARDLTWRLCDDLPEIECAALGYDAGVVGAAALAWQTSKGTLP